MRYFIRFSALIFGGVFVAGCGLQVPDMQEYYEPRDQQKITENTIINHIKCEIHKGADDALEKWKGAGIRSGLAPDWFKTWNATVTLKLAVDEKGSLAPGVSWVRPFQVSNTFTLGAGVGLSSQATRTETISFRYSLSSLLGARRIENPCEQPGSPFLLGDLKIGEFIDKKVFLTTVPGTIVGPYSAFNYDVSFIIITNGSVTPTWKLVDVTANPGSPFASATRTRTHTVSITFAAPNDQAAEEAAKLHNASLIGQAVADALRRSGN
jgi:hypothetical protein